MLDDSSPVRICSVCEVIGGCVSQRVAKRDLDYQCVHCGRRDFVPCGSITTMFEPGSGCNLDTKWDCGELIEGSFSIGSKKGSFGPCGCHQHGTTDNVGSDGAEDEMEDDGNESDSDSDYIPEGGAQHGGEDLVDSECSLPEDMEDDDSIESDSYSDENENENSYVRVRFFEDACYNCHRRASINSQIGSSAHLLAGRWSI